MIALKSIQLKNYRRYKDANIEFPTGLIGIVGRNGSGKSSLIEAVGWCLYGNSASRTKKEQIKTTGVADTADCSVTLEMVLGEDNLKVVRELRGKKHSGHASAHVNGNVEVRGMNEVSEFIAKRTGMDHVAFFTSVFAKQKELDLLSSKQPGERKKIIMRLLRINKIDDAIAGIRADIRHGREKVSTLQNNLKDMVNLEKESERISIEMQEVSIQINGHKERIESLSAKVTKNRTLFAEHEERYKSHNSVYNELVRTREQKKSETKEKETVKSELEKANDAGKRMEELGPKITEYETVNKEKSKLDSLQVRFTEKKGLEGQHAEISSRIANQESENAEIQKELEQLKGLDQEITEQESELKEHEAKMQDLNKSASEIAARMEENRKRRTELDENYSTIKKLGEDGKCPTCKRALRDHLFQVSGHFEQEISKIDERISSDSEERNGLDSKLQYVQKRVKELGEAGMRIGEAKTRRTTLLTRSDDGRRRIEEFRQKRADLEERLEGFSDLRYDKEHHRAINRQCEELAETNNEFIRLSVAVKGIPALSKRQKDSIAAISELEKKEGTKAGELDSIGYDESEHEKSRKNLDDAREDHDECGKNLIRLEGDMKNLALQIEQTAANISEEREKKATIDDENKKIASRTKLDSIMNEFKLDLISRIRPILSQRASELFRKITRGKYSSMELDEDYNILIEDEGNSFATDRFSGGEGDLANLCLRIAISQELAERAGGVPTSFIALDEIFGSQDEGRKGSILEALSEISKQFRQILIITHVEDVKEALPYVLTIKENSDNTVRIETEGIASVPKT